MRVYRNKFKAKHYIAPARLMPGVHSHPGFHTAKSFEVASCYALMRCNDSEQEGNYAIHYVSDYPVVAIFDMRGFKKYLDYDADVTVRETLDDQIKNIVNEYVDIENYDDDRILDIVYRESKFDDGFSCGWDSNAIDIYGANIYDYMSFPLRVICEEKWIPGLIRGYARTRCIPDWVLMYVTGQYRYIEDIPEERVIGVYYLRPLSPHFFNDDESYDEEARRWPGFDCETMSDIYAYSPTHTLVYGDDVLEEKQIDMFGHEISVEYHGTTLDLFKQAAPNIASKLPEPPCPPYKPEEMTQKEYHRKVLESRNEQ